jgi:hypothetical protein
MEPGPQSHFAQPGPLGMQLKLVQRENAYGQDDVLDGGCPSAFGIPVLHRSRRHRAKASSLIRTRQKAVVGARRKASRRESHAIATHRLWRTKQTAVTSFRRSFGKRPNERSDEIAFPSWLVLHPESPPSMDSVPGDSLRTMADSLRSFFAQCASVACLAPIVSGEQFRNGM